MSHSSPATLAVYLHGQPPGAPQNLTVVRGYRQLNLSWQAAAGAVIGYKVYRGTASGNESLLATIGNVLAFNDNIGLGDRTRPSQRRSRSRRRRRT